jgi:hypothetical protein
MRQRNILFLFVLIVLLAQTAGCYYYHEPAFKGTILDIDTKRPIEGAVVVVEYKKASLGLVESPSTIIDVRETLTDTEGNFHVPSYSTLLQPFSWKIPSILLIFKPGYASVQEGNWHFTGEELKEEMELSLVWTKELKYKLRGAGIVEIPKLKTREERIKAKPAPVGEPIDWKKQKQFIKAIREEWQYLYNEDPKALYLAPGEK